MSQPLVSLMLDNRRGEYMPGEVLSGEFQIDAIEPGSARALEVSVLWYTEGKGEEDMAVHYFERIVGDAHDGVPLEALRRFECDLPTDPLTYDGLLIKIRWCVRVRVFMARGKSYVADTAFRLGDLPAAVEVVK